MSEIIRINLKEVVGAQTYDKRACKKVNPDIFFPIEAKDMPENVSAFPVEGIAKKICSECIINTDCEIVAMANEENMGIWSGKDFKDIF